jgi:hypothetical protein
VQPYQDEHDALLAEYHKTKQEYYKNVDPEFLRAYNKYRKRRGKTLRRRPRSESPKPMTGFFRCVEIYLFDFIGRSMLIVGQVHEGIPADF